MGVGLCKWITQGEQRQHDVAQQTAHESAAICSPFAKIERDQFGLSGSLGHRLLCTAMAGAMRHFEFRTPYP